MICQQQSFQSATTTGFVSHQPASARVLLAFGPEVLLESALPIWRAEFADAVMAGCTTAGNISNSHIGDESITVTLLEFSHSQIACAHTNMDSSKPVLSAVRELLAQIPVAGLRHLLVFAEGLHINGSELAAGFNRLLPAGVTVTGGLAGDGDRFGRTAVFNRSGIHHNGIVAIGLYGDDLQIGYGSLGGWESFGPIRRVTKATANVLFELDGHSALSLYKTYLGAHASQLPASALLFPLSVTDEQGSGPVVRTVLSVDETQQSMTFAGDMPIGARTQLMRANNNRLIEGAGKAASIANFRDHPAQFALLISCVGRRLVLQDRCHEEIDKARAILGTTTMLAGFYSYGELCPQGTFQQCDLHNQTMTITTLAELNR